MSQKVGNRSSSKRMSHRSKKEITGAVQRGCHTGAGQKVGNRSSSKRMSHRSKSKLSKSNRSRSHRRSSNRSRSHRSRSPSGPHWCLGMWPHTGVYLHWAGGGLERDHRKSGSFLGWRKQPTKRTTRHTHRTR